MPRTITFCAYAIVKPNEFLLNNDSRKDKRIADNSMVTDLSNIIFYAGIHLVTPNGYALGALCVMDNKPLKLSDIQKDTLKALPTKLLVYLI
ncbi:MAG: hypothetical protein H7101_04180 [Deinococcales bacterium]|nr:hypothetical protein [Chitinophagaceae bacterium]